MRIGQYNISEAYQKQYNQTPKLCLLCNDPIAIQKVRADKSVKFCGRSCATTFTNQLRANRSTSSRHKTSLALRKTKSINKRVMGAFSRVYHNNCHHCNTTFLGRSKVKYCADHQNLYQSNNRNRYAFTFSLSKYPDLFGAYADQLKQVGIWSYSNTNGLTRDHRISVTDAIHNNYDPYYIKHPLNCELMSWTENNKKKGKSSISYQDLVTQILKYDCTLHA